MKTKKKLNGPWPIPNQVVRCLVGTDLVGVRTAEMKNMELTLCSSVWTMYYMHCINFYTPMFITPCKWLDPDFTINGCWAMHSVFDELGTSKE
jgi:hypothetical protein